MIGLTNTHTHTHCGGLIECLIRNGSKVFNEEKKKKNFLTFLTVLGILLYQNHKTKHFSYQLSNFPKKSHETDYFNFILYDSSTHTIECIAPFYRSSKNPLIGKIYDFYFYKSLHSIKLIYWEKKSRRRDHLFVKSCILSANLLNVFDDENQENQLTKIDYFVKGITR